MKPTFSLTYGGVPFAELKYETAGNAVIFPDGLKIETETVEYPEFEAVYRVNRLTNTSESDSALITDLWDCDIEFAMEPEPSRAPGFNRPPEHAKVIRMRGCVPGGFYSSDDAISAEEFRTIEEFISKGQKKQYKNAGGRSSNELMPFFEYVRGDEGMVIAVGWTGNWRAEFTRSENFAGVRTGLQNASFMLHPGESVRTSSVLIMKYHKGSKAGCTRFRRLINEHFTNVGKGERPEYPQLAFETWGALSDAETIRRIDAFKKHGVGFEYHWIDAAWYGTSDVPNDGPYTGTWGSTTGDWRINKNWHPDGLQSVVEHERAAGMSMMLWIEPERVVRGTPTCAAHPEWFFDIGGGSLLINYGCEEALAATFEMISEKVETLGLGCYRQDFNTEPDVYWRHNEPENRVGINEIKHINGMYRLWDMLLEKHPRLLIDNCASGGRRIDIETLRRAVPFFRSDYQCVFNPNPEVTQAHNNLARYLPINGCTTKAKCDVYAARSTFSAAWGGAFWNTGFQTLDEGELDITAGIVAEYRSIRRYFTCDYYSLASDVFDPKSWCVWQYDNPEAGEGIILAFRRSGCVCPSITVCPEAMKEGAVYVLTDRDTGSVSEIAASELSEKGLALTLPSPRSSLLIEYKIRK